MYKTILIPVDLHHPDVAERIIAAGKSLSGPKTRLILLNVIEETPSYIESYLPEGIHEENRNMAMEKLKALARANTIEPTCEVRIGHPHVTILEAAESHAVDIVIIGSHRPGLQDYFLGSTAARVVRHAQCSVLVDR